MTIPITEEQWDEFLNLLENRLDQQDTEIKLLKDSYRIREQQQKKNKPKAINVVKRLMLILRLILTLTMVL